MNLLSTFGLASVSVLCAALAGCAGTTPPATEAVVRTRAPQGVEKTITSYFAFKVRGPQTHVAINVGSPEPGACALDGRLSSSRGWVVPVVYSTRSSAQPGKEAILINGRQYYFWFLGDTIAGVTPRLELCPGTASVEFPQPGAAGDGWLMTSAATSTRADSRGRDSGAGAEPSKGKSAKTSISSGKVRPALKKVGKKSKVSHVASAA